MAVSFADRDTVAIVRHDLEDEFRTALPPDAIVRLAEEKVASFDAAPVRDFVAVLAWRRARGRARAMTADGE